MDFLHSEIGSAKDNFNSPVHNWYKFTAGFSYKFVESILNDYTNKSQLSIFEPFAGCGTTLVSSQKNKVKAVGNEGQEFMLDIINAKLNWNLSQHECIQSLKRISNYIDANSNKFNIERDSHPLLQTLYNPATLRTLYLIKNSLSEIDSEELRLFFKLALSQTMHKAAIHPLFGKIFQIILERHLYFFEQIRIP